jgi:hypothetical protein
MLILVKLLALAGGAVAGFFVFLYGGIVLFCVLFGGNQCGLPAIFFGAPLGAVVGAVAGWIMAGRMMRA